LSEQALLALLGLEEHARLAASSNELAFVMVNDCRAMVVYRQAALFIDGEGLKAVSGVTTLDRGAPFVLWLERLFRHEMTDSTRPLGPESVHGKEGQEWVDWLPPHGLMVPLKNKDGKRIGALLLARDGEPWADQEIALLGRAVDFFAYAWIGLHRPSAVTLVRRRLTAIPNWRKMLAAAALLALLFPVRLSVLAPAEVVAHDPAVIRSPLEGVIEQVLVRPNQPVAAGDLLFKLDRTTLIGKSQVARKALATARAELDQATQQAFSDSRAKSQLSIIRARIDERSAEVTQLEDLIARCEVKAPRAGIAVLDDPAEWQGRPVNVGEKVLAVASPSEVELEAWLAPSDVIALEVQGPVRLFLNADPLSPVSARLLYVTYEAIAQADGTLGYRVRAAFESGQDSPRLGLKGTARLDGRRVPLVYWLARRPLAVIRTFLGI